MDSVIALAMPRTPSPKMTRSRSSEATPRASAQPITGGDELLDTPHTVDVTTPRAPDGHRGALAGLSATQVDNSFLKQLEEAEAAHLAEAQDRGGLAAAKEVLHSLHDIPDSSSRHDHPPLLGEPIVTPCRSSTSLDRAAGAQSASAGGSQSWTTSLRARLRPRARTPLPILEPHDYLAHSAAHFTPQLNQPLAERLGLQRVHDVDEGSATKTPVRRSSIRRQIDKARSYATARLSGGSVRRKHAAGVDGAVEQSRSSSDLGFRQPRRIGITHCLGSSISLCPVASNGGSASPANVEAPRGGARGEERPSTPITPSSVDFVDAPRPSISSLLSYTSVQDGLSATPRVSNPRPATIAVAPLRLPAKERQAAVRSPDSASSPPKLSTDSGRSSVALSPPHSPAFNTSSHSVGWSTRRGDSCNSRGPRKRVWTDESGLSPGPAYKVGCEREILDLEARLHETMFRVAGQSHTFAFGRDDRPPCRVLDIGTGCGLWPIAQASVWPEATFTGLDIVPCQVDLTALVDAKTRLRIAIDFEPNVAPSWDSIAPRIKWDTADCLETLPYESDSFDFVHIRFIGLGLPAHKISELIEEVCRVLAPGGRLEWVEMSLDLPPDAPIQLRNSFHSLLQSESIAVDPAPGIRSALSRMESLSSSRGGEPRIEPVFQQTSLWQGGESEAGPPPPLGDAAMGWAKSAMEYRGTGCRRAKRDSVVQLAKRELSTIDGEDWVFPTRLDSPRTPETPKSATDAACRDEETGMTVSAWVCTKA